MPLLTGYNSTEHHSLGPATWPVYYPAKVQLSKPWADRRIQENPVLKDILKTSEVFSNLDDNDSTEVQVDNVLIY